MANVYFKEGTQNDYESITPDEHTFYKADEDVYLGGVKLSNEADLLKILEQIEDLEERVHMLELGLKPLANCTYQEMQNIVQSGYAADIWSVGDVTADITLNGAVGAYTFENESYKAMLIGLDHNMDLETGGKHNACFQFGQNDDGVNIAFIDSNYTSTGSSAGFRMNTSSTNSGGWENSYMRNTICPQFLEALPSNLQKVIGITTKYTDNVGNNTGSVESNVTATEDKIFLPSYHEIFSGTSNANTYEADYTERYAWYAENDSSTMRVRYRHSAPSSTGYWWLRSPRRSNSYDFCNVTTSGTATNYYAYVSYGLAPAFQIF